MARPLVAEDTPSEVILRSCVCLLRSMVVAAGIHYRQLSKRTTHSLASILHYLVHCGNNKGERHGLVTWYMSDKALSGEI